MTGHIRNPGNMNGQGSVTFVYVNAIVLDQLLSWDSVGAKVHENTNFGLVVPTWQRPRVEVRPVGLVGLGLAGMKEQEQEQHGLEHDTCVKFPN